jgi:Fic family protein
MRPNDRTYLKTHPWLNFVADLKTSPLQMWMNLGAIQSKCDHVANVMLPPAVARELLQVYLAKGVNATTAIEGNTLSEADVLARVQGSAKTLPPSKEYLGREVDNVITACNHIQKLVLLGDVEDSKLSVELIRGFNKTVLDGLKVDDHVQPGEFRKVSVGVGTYRGAPAEDCEYLLARMCEWVNNEIVAPDPAQRIAYGVIRSVLAHLYLAWIHPFGDGNGRTARLVELQILLSVGVPNIASHLLSNHYNQTRAEYYRQLEYASKSGGKIVKFLEYAIQGLFDGLNETIQRVRQYQVEVTWRDYVYQQFNDQKGPVAERRRRLALDLWWEESKEIQISHIPTLTPELAKLYATRTTKTVNRDVSELEEMGLIVKAGNRKIAINIPKLMSFLPGRKVP